VNSFLPFALNTGQGLGASHQTGWTALVTKLLQQSGDSPKSKDCRSRLAQWVRIAPHSVFRAKVRPFRILAYIRFAASYVPLPICAYSRVPDAWLCNRHSGDPSDRSVDHIRGRPAMRV
jgi:hypothetical protein